MEKVTVIVPIFNSEDYLSNCLDSILTQTYENLEILLINDGSTDSSGAICEEYRMRDSRIRVHNKKRGGGGVGAARNTALSLVTGDYILFVDNDDWLEENHIELLYNALKETDSDISVANFTEFIEERQTFAFHMHAEDYFQEVYTPEEWFKVQYDTHFSFSQCFTVPWSKLYKSSLFENIVYPEEEKVEDDYTTWKLYLMANKIVYTNAGIYYHRKRNTSVTKTVSMVHVFPIKSIEERVTILTLAGFDVSNELRAYKWRLKLHEKAFLESGNVYEYKKCIQKIALIERYINK